MSDLPPPAPSSGQPPQPSPPPPTPDDQPGPWYRGPWALLLIGFLAALVVVLIVVLMVRESDEDSEPTPTTTPTATITPAPTTGDGGDVDGGDDGSVAPAPGDPCTVGSDPDCIDPDGDGQGTYLVGGGDCMATSPDPGLCEDLDGDGVAGFPDTG